MLKICLFAISIKQAFEMLEQANEGISEALRVQITSDPRISELAKDYTKYTETLKKQYNNDVKRLLAKHKRYQKEQILKQNARTEAVLAIIKETEKEYIQEKRKVIEKYRMEFAHLEGMKLTLKRRTQRIYSIKISELWKKYDTTDKEQLKKFIAEAEELESKRDFSLIHYDEKYITESSQLKHELLQNLQLFDKKIDELAKIAIHQSEIEIEESVRMELDQKYERMKILIAEKYRNKEDNARSKLGERINMLAVVVVESICSESICDHASEKKMSIQISKMIFEKMKKEFDLLPKIPNPDLLHTVTEILKDYADSFDKLFREGDVEEMESLTYYMMGIVQNARDQDFDEHSDQYHFPCKERYQHKGDAYVEHCNEYQLAVKLLTGEQLWDVWGRLKRYHNFT